MHKDVQWLDEAWRYWCREHADELPLPIQSMRQTRKGISLAFAGVHPKLKFLANDDSVKAMINDSQTLFSFGISIAGRRPDGRWHCIVGGDDNHASFATEFDLWEGLIFKPWLNETRRLLRPGMWIVTGEDAYQADLIGGVCRTSRWRRAMGVKQWCEAVPQSEALKQLAFHRGVNGGFRVIPDPQFQVAHSSR